MSNNYLRITNAPRVYTTVQGLGGSGGGVMCLYYDISNNYLAATTMSARFSIGDNGKTTFLSLINTNFKTSTFCYYNGHAFTIELVDAYTLTNKILLYNSTYPNGTVLTTVWPTITNLVMVTGCAVYGNTFYVTGVVGLNVTTTPYSFVVMQTSLSTTNPNNPFNTTTPTFTQTYQSFQTPNRVFFRATSLCCFDNVGNLYITSSSGVYKYPVNSTYNSVPSRFIPNIDDLYRYYVEILYNPVYEVFYLCDTRANARVDLFNKEGVLIKQGYITNVSSPNNESPFQLCCDPLGTLYYSASYYNTHNGDIGIVDKYVCFKKDTLILTLQGYKRIQHLKKGDFVKTLKHQFVPIYKIGFSEIHHPCVENRFLNILFEVKYLIFKRLKNNSRGGEV